MELKDLVPPVELCKQIPEGKFADTALVWCTHTCNPWELIMREWKTSYQFEKYIPAPTLQEILKELPAYDEDEHFLWCIADFPKDGEIRVFGEAWRVGYSLSDSQLDRNPATAALRLWLSVTSDKSDKSERGNQ